jgi:hypothetical protein
MEKVIKHKSDLFNQEITFTVSEDLNRLKGKNLAPKSLAGANELLRKLKGPLPEGLSQFGPAQPLKA